MKKLLALLLVLGVATAANAGLVDAVQDAFEFSVDGEPQPAEVTIIEVPSGSITLDLKLLAGHNVEALDFTWNLSNAQAELLYSGIVLEAFDMGLAVNTTVSTPQLVKIAGGQIYSPAKAGPLTLMDGLVLHCLEDTDVVLTVTLSGSSIIDGETYYGPIGEVLHTLVIHQIPEPATIVLLGLGGLLLRKRRK